jgi:hypothetical protein
MVILIYMMEQKIQRFNIQILAVVVMNGRGVI